MSRVPIVTYERYLALDIHTNYWVGGGVNSRQEIILSPRRVDYERWAEWMNANLKSTDAIVLEATTTAWQI
jgi:hypothetical protein